MDRTFVGAAKRLDDIDLPKLGACIGVGEDEIHAFVDVETRGHGFDAQGRPIILFEPHVFHRNLTGDALAQAVAQGLAYPEWGEKPYPKDSYPRLIAACAIDETAALKSASWGLGQVLGENFEAAGFLTPQAMVEGMMADEEIQLAAAINFIQHNHLDAALRSHNWAAFALGYNGKSYAKNEYDVRLADAFRKWSRIKDTPWVPGKALPAPIVVKDPASDQSITIQLPAPASQSATRPVPTPPHHSGLIAIILMLLAAAATFFHLGH